MKNLLLAFAAILFGAIPCLAQTAPPGQPPIAAPTERIPQVDLMAPLDDTVTLGHAMPSMGKITLKSLDGSDLLVVQPDGSFECAKRATSADLGSLAHLEGYGTVLNYISMCGERKHHVDAPAPVKASAAPTTKAAPKK